jgi:putative membrane protein
MTYRLVHYIIIAICYFGGIFFWMLFFTDLGQAWLKMPWMHVNWLLYLCAVLIPCKMPTNFKQLQNDEVFHKFHAFVERRRHYPLP